MKRLLPALLLLAGCSSGLVVDTYPTAPRTDADCDALYADGAQKVAGQEQVLVKGTKATAWVIRRSSCAAGSPHQMV